MIAAPVKSGADRSSNDRIVTEIFAQVFRAFMEASNEVQDVIRDMCAIYNSEEADADEREAAVATLVEALFPVSHNGELGIDIDELDKLCSKCPEFKEELDKSIEAQATFADRLQAAMDKADMDQTTLARLIGVQQPAISMMLARSCNPQRKTVEKIAAALNVRPEDLWPTRRP